VISHHAASIAGTSSPAGTCEFQDRTQDNNWRAAPVLRAPPEVELRNTQGVLGWRIDTRARGGYVVGAGSIRRDGRYCITRRREIAALPTWLTDALAPAAPHRETGERVMRLHTRGRYLQAILDRESDAVAAAQPGTRHTTLLAAACTLGCLVAGRGTRRHAASAPGPRRPGDHYLRHQLIHIPSSHRPPRGADLGDQGRCRPSRAAQLAGCPPSDRTAAVFARPAGH